MWALLSFGDFFICAQWTKAAADNKRKLASTYEMENKQSLNDFMTIQHFRLKHSEWSWEFVERKAGGSGSMSRVLKLHSGKRICECVFSMVYLLVVFRTLFLLFISIYYKRTFWCMLPFLFHLKSMICEFSFQILNKSQTKANQEKNSIDKRVSLILSCHIKSRKLSCRHILALALSRLFILDVCLLISVFFFYFHDVF